jgi:hypothetical protein
MEKINKEKFNNYDLQISTQCQQLKQIQAKYEESE